MRASTPLLVVVAVHTVVTVALGINIVLRKPLRVGSPVATPDTEPGLLRRTLLLRRVPALLALVLTDLFGLALRLFVWVAHGPVMGAAIVKNVMGIRDTLAQVRAARLMRFGAVGAGDMAAVGDAAAAAARSGAESSAEESER